MLPLTLPREQILSLLDDGENLRDVEVDLATQRVNRHDGTSYEFDVDPFRKHCLINGLDDIGLSLQKIDAIRAFETARSERFPWLDGATTRVPKLFAVDEKFMPASAALDTPTPEQWRAEVHERRKAERM